MKSFYYSLIGRSPKGFLLGIVWNPFVSMRVSFFAWEAVWEIFLNLDKLKRRGWCLPSRCCLCKDEEDSANHILLHCPKATLLWHLILALFNVQWVMPFSIKDTFLSWRGSFVGKKRKKAWRAAPL